MSANGKVIGLEIKIAGTSPLLINAFTDEAQMAATEGTAGSFNGDRGTPQEQAESKLYKDEEEALGIPSPNVLRCIMDGGLYFKSGRSKITTQRSSLIPACFRIEQAFLHLEHKQPWKVDTRPVRIPATGGRILRHRPCFDDWALTMTANLDTSLLSAKVMRDVVDSAGQRVGLGDFRPSTKGPFGTFKVTHWKEKENGV